MFFIMDKKIGSKVIEKWTTLESRYIIKRPWLTARVDSVQLPDGRINPEHYVLEYPDWVNVIAVTEDDEIVFIRQYRHAMDVVSVEIPAGVIEPGEEPMDAAKRELAEETGYGGGEWQWLMDVAQNPSICNNMTHCFLARGVKRLGDQHLDAGEDIAVLTLTHAEALAMMRRGGDMTQALMLAPLWRYFYQREPHADLYSE